MPARRRVRSSATAKRSTRSTRSSRPPSRATRATSTVRAWEDDPGDPRAKPALEPIAVGVPNPASTPLAFRMTREAPAPAMYPVGGAPFRYFAAAASLRRTADFWSAIVPRGTTWQVGARLPVTIDDGVDLNAFYTRGEGGEGPGLHFFHAAVGGRVFFSGESPDVASHEMGHAVLDAVRPQLFNAQSIETAAFHESFGDMSAMLSALQVPSFVDVVLEATGGTLNRASRLSRLAEQLGAAIRAGHPDAVDADCLRSAVNSFAYHDPQTLPAMAPASHLSSEPHSFSRVFTGAFLDVLAGMLKVEAAKPNAAAVTAVTRDAARLLMSAAIDAPVVPDYYSQIAAHMVQAGESAPFRGKYRDVLKSAFVRRGILSLQASGRLGASPASARRVARPANRPAELPLAAVAADHFGLTRSGIHVHIAGESHALAVSGATPSAGTSTPNSAQRAAEIYTADLFQRGHVDLAGFGYRGRAIRHPLAVKTHRLVMIRGELVLKRRVFDCWVRP